MTEQLQNDLFTPTSTLLGDISDSVTSLTVALTHGQRFPLVGNYRIRIDDELLLVTARSTDVLTIERGAEGTTAAAHLSGVNVDLVVTAAALRTALVLPTQMNGGTWGIWNRGNGPFTADAAWCADGWRLDVNGTSTLQVDREFTETVGVFSGSSGKITYVQGSLASRVFNKHADFVQIRGREVTFSHPVKSSVANAVRLQIYDGITTTSGAYHPGDGAWGKPLRVTKTIADTATTVEWAISFEASGTFYVDNGQWVFGPEPGDYLPPDPTFDGFRSSLYYQRVKVSLEGHANLAGERITIPIPWKRAQASIVGTSNVKRVTAGTATNLAATYPQVDGTDITGGAQVAVGSFGGRITIQSAAGGDFALIDELLEWESNP